MNTFEIPVRDEQDSQATQFTETLTGEPELTNPLECSFCGGHIALDISFLEQVDWEIRCPYCGEACEVIT